MNTPSRDAARAAAVVIAAGVCAALHIGKLPPAIDALRGAYGMSLLQAGALLSVVQVAGMLLAVALGVAADGIGARRSMACGLTLLAAAAAIGGAASGIGMLMALRVLEGVGILLVVLPAPGLVRSLLPPGRVSAALGFWGAYMPLGTGLALLLGPPCVAAFGWRAWWWALAALTLAMAALLLRGVPPDRSRAAAGAGAAAPVRWTARLRQTLSAPGPWLLALCFAVYAGPWLAVIGFLPVIAGQAGLRGGAIGVLAAVAAAVNIVGNVGAGRLLSRGVPAARLLAVGYAVIGVSTWAVFAGHAGAGLPPLARYAAVLVFSSVGGLVPATLFALAVRFAPGAGTVSTTVGWLQQWSSFGQVAVPPLVAWVASRSGGWQNSWLVTGSCATAGLLLTALMTRVMAAALRPGAAATAAAVSGAPR